MKKSDRTILMFLPTALIILFYAVLVNPRSQSSYRRMTQQYQAAKKNAPSDQQLLTAKTRITAAKKVIERLQSSVRSAESNEGQLGGQLGDASQQIEAVRELEKLATAHAIATVNQETVVKPKVSKILTEVLGRVEKAVGQSKLKYRRYQLRGGYANFVTFLRELTKSVRFLVPLSIEMDAAESRNGQHSWTLLVVM